MFKGVWESDDDVNFPIVKTSISKESIDISEISPKYGMLVEI